MGHRHQARLTLIALCALAAAFWQTGLAAQESRAGLVVPAIGDFPIGEVGEKDLLGSEVFMQALWGMKIEAVKERASSAKSGCGISFRGTT